MTTVSRQNHRYHSLAPLDAGWFGLESVRVIGGLNMPSPHDVRRSLRILHESDDLVARHYDMDNRRYRVAALAEHDERCAAMVVDSRNAQLDYEAFFEEAHAPLGALPFRLVIGDTWLSIRISHAFGDGWSCLMLVAHLLRQAASPVALPLPWDVVSAWRQQLMSVGGVARRPGALLKAAWHRRAFSGGQYEPAELRTARYRPTTVVRSSGPGFLDALASQRDRAWPGASMAAIVLVRLRAALADRQIPADNGIEMLFDLRRDASVIQRAFGNWAAGITVRPQDNDDPVSVTSEIRRIRRSGVPHVAAAASRLRARGAHTGGRQVLTPGSRPRLTLSYINRHGPLAQLPWNPAAVPVVGLRGLPNGLGAISVSAHETGSRLSLSLSFYDQAWPRDAVAAAVDTALEPTGATPVEPRQDSQPKAES